MAPGKYLISIAAIVTAITINERAFAQFNFKEFSPGREIGTERLREILGKKEIVIPDGPSSFPGPQLQPTLPSDPPTAPPAATPRGVPVGDDVQPRTPLEAAKQRIDDQFDPRIVGGVPASIEEFPWQVVLIAGETPAEIRSPFCGGSIISSQWIVTAAHCLNGVVSPQSVDVVAGSAFPKFPNQGDRVTVSKIIVHPSYNNSTFEHDIALLRLSRPLKRGKPVKLADERLDIPVNAGATVSGWGAVTAYMPMVDRLLKATVPVVSNDTCNNVEAYSGAVKEGMLCAGYREGGVDACQGDSGGPLVASVNSQPMLIGIVSWGRGCALRLKYGVYTRVTKYAGWVKSELAKPQIAQR